MKNKLIIFCGIFLVFLSLGCFLFFGIRETPIQEIVSENHVAPQNHVRNSSTAAAVPVNGTGSVETKVKKAQRTEVKENTTISAEDTTAESYESEPVYYPDTIEEIKQQIYSKNIEYVDQIKEIDALVQTGDMDTRELWNADWTSADDWKKKSNGFKLEKNDDGALIFTPDEQTARTYTFFENPQAYAYDEENNEFVNEFDFYGKTIYNVAKFINDDVLVMMTISGSKVDLNIYQKNSDRK